MRSAALLNSRTTSQYIYAVEEIIRKELNNIDTYFADEEARQKTRIVLHTQLYLKPMGKLLEVKLHRFSILRRINNPCFSFYQNKESGLIAMLLNKQSARLKTLFLIFNQVAGAVPAMAKCFSDHFRPRCVEEFNRPEILAYSASFMKVCHRLFTSSLTFII